MIDAKDTAIVARHLVVLNRANIPVFTPNAGRCCINREGSAFPVQGCQGSPNLCFCDEWSRHLSDSCFDLPTEPSTRKRAAEDEFPDPCCCKSRIPQPADQCLPLARDICIDERDTCWDTEFCCCLLPSSATCVNATSAACATTGGVCVAYPGPTTSSPTTSAAPTGNPTPQPTHPETCALQQHPALVSSWPADVSAQVKAYDNDVKNRADVDGNGVVDTNDFNAWVLLTHTATAWPCDMSCPLPRPDIDGDGTLTQLDMLLYLAPNLGSTASSPLYCS